MQHQLVLHDRDLEDNLDPFAQGLLSLDDSSQKSIRTKSSWMSKTLTIQYTYKYRFFCPSINSAFSA